MKTIKGTVHEGRHTVLIVSRTFLLRMTDVSGKRFRENQNTHFIFNNLFFPENHAFYEITWKNIIEMGRSQTTIWRMHFTCWIPKATNTQYECLILIVFPLQEQFNGRASLLRYIHIACLVRFSQWPG